jgi:hypothetical protein
MVAESDRQERPERHNITVVTLIDRYDNDAYSLLCRSPLSWEYGVIVDKEDITRLAIRDSVREIRRDYETLSDELLSWLEDEICHHRSYRLFEFMLERRTTSTPSMVVPIEQRESVTRQHTRDQESDWSRWRLRFFRDKDDRSAVMFFACCRHGWVRGMIYMWSHINGRRCRRDQTEGKSAATDVTVATAATVATDDITQPRSVATDVIYEHYDEPQKVYDLRHDFQAASVFEEVLNRGHIGVVRLWLEYEIFTGNNRLEWIKNNHDAIVSIIKEFGVVVDWDQVLSNSVDLLNITMALIAEKEGGTMGARHIHAAFNSGHPTLIDIALRSRRRYPSSQAPTTDRVFEVACQQGLIRAIWQLLEEPDLNLADLLDDHILTAKCHGHDRLVDLLRSIRGPGEEIEIPANRIRFIANYSGRPPRGQ